MWVLFCAHTVKLGPSCSRDQTDVQLELGTWHKMWCSKLCICSTGQGSTERLQQWDLGSCSSHQSIWAPEPSSCSTVLAKVMQSVSRVNVCLIFLIICCVWAITLHRSRIHWQFKSSGWWQWLFAFSERCAHQDFSPADNENKVSM